MEKNTFNMPAIILGGAFIVSAAIGAYAFYSVRALENTLSVTGSAKQAASADAARWSISVMREASSQEALASAHTRITQDVQVVQKYLTDNGIPAEAIDVNPEFVNEEYRSNTSLPRSYTIRQELTVSLNNPELIDRLSKDIASLVSRGVNVTSQMPQYYVTTLPQIRIALIGKAVEDARARAGEIAKSTGQRVGALKSASSGVVQVMAPNSIDVSDYGSYDTSTIEKEVMVTARAVFLLK